MIPDLRFAFRQLTRSPGFTLVAVLTLALGIGANTAIFSIVNTLLLEPLPYPDSERIVQVNEFVPAGGNAGSCGGVFLDWQDHTTRLEAIAAMHTIDKNLSGGGEPMRVSGADVTADYLKVLGIRPALGRDFLPAEDAPGGNRFVVILSDALWRNRFGADPNVIDTSVQFDTQSYTVIGVLSPHVLLQPNLDFLSPATIRADQWKQSRDYNYVLSVIGRLKPGATALQAQAELRAAKEALNSQYPTFKQPWTVSVTSLHEATFGNSRPYVLTLLAAVGAVLLIACANVANLLLAKAATREGEIAVRVALGATTRHVLQQLLTESLLLALIGGAVGVLAGSLSIQPLLVFANIPAIPGMPFDVDLRVLGFALAATVATGLLFGIFPALRVARPNLNEYLKEGTRGSSAGSRRRLQSLLIVAETALTVVLLVTAGLLLRSFMKALGADAGFKRDHVLVFDLSRPNTKSPTADDHARFVEAVMEKVGQIPGVASVGMTAALPMNGRNYYGDLINRTDQPEKHDDTRAGFNAVAGDYFQTLGIPLLRGRYLTPADNREASPKVMLVNQALARLLFGDEDPLGRQLHFKEATWEIVGVVGNVRQFQLDFSPVPECYHAEVFFPWYKTIAVRTKVPPLTLADDVRHAVQAVDPDQPIANLTTLAANVDRSLQGRTVMLSLLGLFAVVALLLACIGIYGVMAYTVEQRTREMGIRIALGAAAPRVISLVLRDGMRLVLLGVVLGVLVALFGTNRVVANQLYDVTTRDPVVFLVVSLALLVTAVLACWLPARRATRVNPIDALRAE